MSEERLKDVDDKTIEEHGIERLVRRSARLARLVELRAPQCLIIREFIMVEEAMKLVSPFELANERATREYNTLKVQLGFCSRGTCQLPALKSSVKGFCPAHELEEATEEQEVNQFLGAVTSL